MLGAPTTGNHGCRGRGSRTHGRASQDAAVSSPRYHNCRKARDGLLKPHSAGPVPGVRTFLSDAAIYCLRPLPSHFYWFLTSLLRLRERRLLLLQASGPATQVRSMGRAQSASLGIVTAGSGAEPPPAVRSAVLIGSQRLEALSPELAMFRDALQPSGWVWPPGNTQQVFELPAP